MKKLISIKNNKAITLAELVIAAGIGLILVATAFLIWKMNLGIFFSKQAMMEVSDDLRSLYVNISTDLKQAYFIEEPAPGNETGTDTIKLKIFNDISQKGIGATVADIDSIVDDVEYTFDEAQNKVYRKFNGSSDRKFDNITDFTVYPVDSLPEEFRVDKAKGVKYGKMHSGDIKLITQVVGNKKTSLGVMVDTTGKAEWNEGSEEVSLRFMATSKFLCDLIKTWNYHTFFNSLDNDPDY